MYASIPQNIAVALGSSGNTGTGTDFFENFGTGTAELPRTKYRYRYPWFVSN